MLQRSPHYLSILNPVPGIHDESGPRRCPSDTGKEAEFSLEADKMTKSSTGKWSLDPELLHISH